MCGAARLLRQNCPATQVAARKLAGKWQPRLVHAALTCRPALMGHLQHPAWGLRLPPRHALITELAALLTTPAEPAQRAPPSQIPCPGSNAAASPQCPAPKNLPPHGPPKRLARPARPACSGPISCASHTRVCTNERAV